jgi:hypothetical protein
VKIHCKTCGAAPSRALDENGECYECSELRFEKESFSKAVESAQVSQEPYAYEVIVCIAGSGEISRKELTYEKPNIQENRHYDYQVNELFLKS